MQCKFKKESRIYRPSEPVDLVETWAFHLKELKQNSRTSFLRSWGFPEFSVWSFFSHPVPFSPYQNVTFVYFCLKKRPAFRRQAGIPRTATPVTIVFTPYNTVPLEDSEGTACFVRFCNGDQFAMTWSEYVWRTIVACWWKHCFFSQKKWYS